MDKKLDQANSKLWRLIRLNLDDPFQTQKLEAYTEALITEIEKCKI
jgi:hypothetical protein